MLGCGDDAIRMSPPLDIREDQARTALEIFETRGRTTVASAGG